jgi:SAM-dependent methyltransferase
MAGKTDLYDSAYANYGAEVCRQVREETYGEDLGQTSWVTTEESAAIPRLLRLTADAIALEIGCGSGRYALKVAETTGCRVTGVDINDAGLRNANQLAAAAGLGDRVRFERCDVSQGLPFDAATFDAVFSNDVLCHVPGRLELFQSIARVMKPGGRLLFSDALVIGGIVSHAEIATRSSIGYYSFGPPGENERLLREAGLRVVETKDATENAALIAKRWHDARARRRDAIVALESETNFEGLQKFLRCVYTVSSEKRLRRYLYVAEKEN